MKNIIENLFGFLYTLSMGDYIFFACTFILLMLFVYMLYLIKIDEDIELKNDEISNLESIKNAIERDYKPEAITLTDYEEEQEDNAIISYDELVNNKNKINISYDEDYTSNTEEIFVKKININDINSSTEKISNLNVRLMSYDKEEAFLEALKRLQQNLIN